MLTQQVAMLQKQIGMLINAQTAGIAPAPTGQTSTTSTDGPEPTITAPLSGQIGGVNPPQGQQPATAWNQQREDDAASQPLWDFGAIATAPVEGQPVFPAEVLVLDPANVLDPADDSPGVGSAGDDAPPASAKLAPKPRSGRA